MEQQIVNEIYWPPDIDNSFIFGSQIRVQANDEVCFNNRLMTPGVAMKKWAMAVNYQGAKFVPQLPHLQINHQYRLTLHAHMQPSNSVLVRLIFFDLQGNELKRYDFNRASSYFTVPVATISWKMELINAGNEQIDFRRIEICERNVSKDANQDLWFQSPMHATDTRSMSLLVIPANRRAKRTFPLLNKVASLPVQVVLVDYQYQGDLTADLAAYLRRHDRLNDLVVSCDPRFDIPVLNLQKALENVRTLVTNTHEDRLNMFNSGAYQLPHVYKWANPNTVEPNWSVIMNAVQKFQEGN